MFQVSSIGLGHKTDWHFSFFVSGRFQDNSTFTVFSNDIMSRQTGTGFLACITYDTSFPTILSGFCWATGVFRLNDNPFRIIKLWSHRLEALKSSPSTRLFSDISRYVISVFFILSLHASYSSRTHLLLIHSSKASSSFTLKGFLSPPLNLLRCFPLAAPSSRSISLLLARNFRILLCFSISIHFFLERETVLLHFFPLWALASAQVYHS